MSVKIRNKEGLHARPASRLVQLCHKFDSEITIKYNNHSTNAKNITEVLSLGIEKGEIIDIYIKGSDESESFDALSSFFNNSIHKNPV